MISSTVSVGASHPGDISAHEQVACVLTTNRKNEG